MVEFHVLGSFELITNGTVVTPRASKLRSVLALLCVNTGGVVASADLVDALWSGRPPRTARTALQVYVSKLRKHLRDVAGIDGRLVTRPHGYLLETDDGELDLARFDRLVAQADAAWATQRWGEALQELTAACALWRGPALADLRGRPAFDAIGRRLDERRIDVVERRIELQVREGQHRAVVAELYGLTHDHPTWEGLHCQLMLSLYRVGRVAESLDVYRTITGTLIREIGIEPGERIRRLHHSILTRDPALDGADAPTIAVPAQRGGRVVIGR